LDGGIIERIFDKRGYIMISPKATSWYDALGLKDLVQLLELVQQEYPKADKKHCYCTGLSRGGGGSYQLAATYPGLLAGIACVSGAGGGADMNNLKNTVVLVINGGADMVTRADGVQKVVDQLKQQGVTYEHNVFPTYGHDYHSEEYMNLTLDFFEKYKK